MLLQKSANSWLTVRERALEYLESVPLQLLSQLHTSVERVHAHRAASLPMQSGRAGRPMSGMGKGTGKGKRKSIMAVLSDEEEDDAADDEQQTAVVRDGKGRAGAAVDWDKVGVEFRLRNRKTG